MNDLAIAYVAAHAVLSTAHAFVVARILKKYGAPAYAYILVPVWFVFWPLKSLNAVWATSCVQLPHSDS